MTRVWVVTGMVDGVLLVIPRVVEVFSMCVVEFSGLLVMAVTAEVTGSSVELVGKALLGMG